MTQMDKGVEDGLPLRCTECYLVFCLFYNIAWTQLLKHFDFISVFSFLLNAMESPHVAERGLLHMQHPGLQTKVAIVLHIIWGFLGLWTSCSSISQGLSSADR